MADLLAEQRGYYRAMAPDYDEAAERDRAEQERPELESTLARFAPTGDVLELAGGTGQWTVSLAHDADRLTVLDGSEETLAFNRAKTATSPIPIEYVVADLFEWRPPRRYDAVFFSYWLTHVPEDRFDAFWALVDAALRPDGRLFFIDDALARSDPDDPGGFDDPGRGLSHRRTQGREYSIVKVYRAPETLEARLAVLGFDVSVTTTRHGYCLYGQGRRVDPGRWLSDR